MQDNQTENLWTKELAKTHVLNFDKLNDDEQRDLLLKLNHSAAPSEFFKQKKQLKEAIANNSKTTSLLDHNSQNFPQTISANQKNSGDLRNFAIVLMAGGEGERLRLSLLEKGYNEKDLQNFTKATFPLPGFEKNIGALQINLIVIASLCKKHSTDIPVIITTGPKGSATANLIPKILKDSDYFGLKNIQIIPQNERLHLTAEGQIAFSKKNRNIALITNPDETGGPIMKLKEKDNKGNSSLSWLNSMEKSKILLLQGTAIYDPELIEDMTCSSTGFDGLGIGIERSDFPSDDPYGTFVMVGQEHDKSLRIVEQGTRNNKTLSLQNKEGKFLPFNTGFYIFDTEILATCDLPQYCTPPKEILPNLPKAPKAGYAATDIITFAKKPAVLTIENNRFAVIKNADDPEKLSLLGKKYGLDTLCRNHINEN